jgi:putative ABC transport system permease protein
MSLLRAMTSGLRSLFRRSRVEDDLDEELHGFLELATEEKMKQGMSRENAFRAVRLDRGSLEVTKEIVRSAGWESFVETCWQDLRFAIRMLRKNPGFAAAAMLSLALGIAATSVLFSILDGAYIHYAPTEQGNRIALIAQQFTKRETDTSRFSPAEYFDIARLHRSFEGFFALRHASSTLTEASELGENPERIPIVRATSNIFPLYGTSALVGRVFTGDEDRPGAPNVAVITYRLWNRRFARNPSIVGQTIKLDGVPYTVVGITPRRFQQWGADIYLPLALDPASTNRSERALTVAAVMKQGLSAEQTAPPLQDLARQVEAEYGAAYPEYAGLVYKPYDVRKAVVGDLRSALYVLLGAVAMLLLIAAANIANLLLARARARSSEIVTRVALGATPGRLARQFFTESIVLSTIAGLWGSLFGIWALAPVMALIPAHYIGEESEIHASPSAFFVSLGVALVLGVVFGMGPATLIARRSFAGNLSRSRTRLAADHGGGRARALLVFSEVALAFLVVTGAGLMVRTYQQMISMDLGLRSDHVLTLRIALPELKYRGSTAVANFFRELLRSVHSVPSIGDAAVSSIRPLDGEALRDFSIPGRLLNSADGIATADYRVVTPEYFAVIRTPLRAGRFFAEQDGLDATRVAIVNEKFARTYFLGEDAVGKQIRLESRYDSRITPLEAPHRDLVQIVGVVQDSRQIASSSVHDFYESASPEIFVPFWQHQEAGRDLAVLLRTQTEPGTLAQLVRARVLEIDGNQPVYDVQTLEQLAEVAFGPARLCVLLLMIFAGAALLTASVGLFAIVSYTVTQRTNEIGIRMALGASRRDVLRVVITEGMLVIGAGLAIGLLASFGLTRVMSSLLFRVPSNDPLTLISVSVILCAVAILATYIPARRALHVDPMVALRFE